MLLKVILFLAVGLVYGAEKLNIHIVPHTHDDVGWLKTVDEYYYGGLKNIQDASVQYILDTVTTELAKNPDRKFIYVEIAFFYRWWNQQTDQTKEKIRELVKNRQLEFINGGWCMNDEATTHYNAIIDQMTVGLKFIERNFGPDARPTIGWQIDPFGHSAEQANLFTQFGFNGFFFGRIDYADKIQRLNTSTMEMVWRGSASLKELSDIFAGVLYTGYGPPGGFCWDQHCGDDPIQDDKRLTNYNVDEKVDQFIKEAHDQASHYKTNNIILTMGSDFQYSNALMWFKNLDKLIKYVNKNGTVNAMYSTPSIYLEYLYKANKTWTIKTDDFFPYADNPHAYWTGYFTSRPGIKGYVRKCNKHLQVCKHMEAFHNGAGKFSSDSFKRAMGVAQHHDAVAGTEKQHVADDYAWRLHEGEVECREVISDAMNAMLTKKSTSPAMDLKFCEYLNISVCPPAENGSFNLVAYNPLARPYQQYIRFPSNIVDISVIDSEGNPLPIQIAPVSDSTNAVRRELSSAPYEAVVSLMSSPIPALGYRVYTVRPNTKGFSKPIISEKIRLQDDPVITNKFYEVVFDGETGHIRKISNKMSNISMMVNQQFYWYNSSDGHNKESSQASGAYIFRPNNSNVFPVDFENNKADIVNVIKGDLFTEVQQQFSKWVQQTVRLYADLPAIEVEYTIGPIPVQDSLGKEVISRFDTDLKTNSVFFTDANGREMMRRKLNYRPSFKYNSTYEPVAGNYYPVNSRILIKDDKPNGRYFVILNDRSQGGSSLKDGSVELMVHRRMLYDDGRGAGEALNETGQYEDGLIIRGKQYLILDNETSSTYLHRMLGEGLMLEPELIFAESNGTFNATQNSYDLKGSMIKKDLPQNVHLLTLELLEPNVFLMRLDHQFAASDSVMNTDATVSLSDFFFPGVNIKNVTELCLGANAALSDIHLYQWTTEDGRGGSRASPSPVVPPNFNVKLSPMQIRTFNVTVDASLI